jgi:fatty acid desaturase
VERGAAPKALRREAAGVASVRATANERVAPPGRSAFDLAFALVIALWALAVALALTTGAEWWFFSFCVVATTVAAVFGILDSTAFRQKRRQR